MVATGLQIPVGANIKGEATLILPPSSDKKDLLKLTEKERSVFYQKNIGFVFQEPMAALNPAYTCGFQVMEALSTSPLTKAEKKAKVIELFTLCDIAEAELAFDKYPHQMSGGQLQRVVIAMALIKEPALVIADEPNTALDPETGERIAQLLLKLCSEKGAGLIFISHDLNTVEKIAHRVIILQQGKVIEQGTTADVFQNPQQPYTKALLGCHPARASKTHFLPAVHNFLNDTPLEKLPVKNLGEDILKVEELAFSYNEKLEPVFKAFNLTIKQGETIGITGPSGCGKTTLGKCIAGWLIPNAGKISIANEVLDHQKKPKSWPKLVQYVFQDPYSSLNPKKTILDILKEPLLFFGMVPKGEAESYAGDLLEKVELPRNTLFKYPHELSGGQRQRIVIARALCVQPKVLVLDESVAALDLSVQAQVLNLLIQLQAKENLTYILISHDHEVVNWFCDRVIRL